MHPPPGFRSIPLPVAQLRLDIVLRCGQSFLWHVYPLPASPPSPTHEYRLCLPDRLICLRQSTDQLFYRAVFPSSPLYTTSASASSAGTVDTTEAWLRDYFQLDVDLESLYATWVARDKIFARAAGRFSALGGIRMLRQDPWECLMSFICSQNNHISRITKMVHSLPLHFAPALLSAPHPTVQGEVLSYHPFPGPEALEDPAVESRLRALGFGYRARYIRATAAALCARGAEMAGAESAGAGGKDGRAWLAALRKAELADAREALLKLDGVGPKVADCVLLMSLDKPQVVPVDTHVYQIATKHYGLKGPKGKPASMTPALYRAIGEKFLGVWGAHAGWAHAVLFAADLRAFADYGADGADGAGREESEEVVVEVETGRGMLSPPPTPGPSSLTSGTPARPLRKRATRTTAVVTPIKPQQTQRHARGMGTETIPPTPDSLPAGLKRKRDYFDSLESDAADEEEAVGRVTKLRMVKLEPGMDAEDLDMELEQGRSLSLGDRVKMSRRRRTVRRVI